MKKNLLILFVLMLSGPVCFAQLPNSFSHPDVTGAHDQLVQGPCLAHATVAGMEAMYMHFYNEAINLSELALFSCTNESQNLFDVVNYARDYGAILDVESDTETTYPKQGDPAAYGKIWGAVFNCQDKQISRGSRYKIVYEKVTNLSRDNIKEILYHQGPIIFSNGMTTLHAMLLIGWTADNKWIVKDSYPGIANFAAQYSMGLPYVGIAEAYFIKNIIKETYINNTWVVEFKILKKTIPNPLCYNQGIVYELKGYDNLVNATVNWTYTASSQYEKSLSLIKNNNNMECTVLGNAANVKLCATITRNNGIVQNVTLDIGTVGVPTKLSTLNGHCAGTNYEITSKIDHPGLPGCSYSYSYNIPASSDGSYYAIKSGQYAYWVFKTPNGLQYSATVTATQNYCSPITSTQYAIIYSQWCGTSYKSANDGDVIDSTQVLEDLAISNRENFEENSPLVSPNPARNDLTLAHTGKGINYIRIYDLSGSLIYSVKTKETVTIDVSMIPRGIYIVRYFVDDTANPVKPIKIVLE